MKISPSIISCKLEFLEEQIGRSVEAGADQFHLDIMDGHFVPNLTMGPDLIGAIRRCTDLPLEAHMMVTYPDKYWKKFSDAGADILMFHYESPVNLKSCLKDVRESGKDYGIVINPETPFRKVEPFLEGAKILLIMTVYPGFSGQSFIGPMVPKIEEARKYMDEHSLETEIEIDGGINGETGKIAVEAGADILVSASFIYGGDILENIKILKGYRRTKT
ncbi:MAG: ribulose-phosphate 3-epimerase [Cuniculiplasma sp.]